MANMDVLGPVERRRVWSAEEKAALLAIEHHRKKIRFFGTVDPVNALEQEKQQGRSGQLGKQRQVNARFSAMECPVFSHGQPLLA